MARDIKRADTIEPTEVRWLWVPYIARRKLTLLDGDPGAGKSNIALELTARITSGAAFPGHTPGATHKPRQVLYLTQEDDLDDTVVPRLMRAGADLGRVLLDDKPLALSTQTDVDDLARIVRSERPALVVLDTLAGYIGSSTDVFRENSVRPVLMQLALIAREYNTSVVALRHLTKGDKTKALYLGQGSIAMAGVARSVLLAASDPNNSDRRALFQVKNNLGRMADPLGYGFSDNGTLVWDADTDMTLADALAQQSGEGSKSKHQRAAEVIVAMLSSGPIESRLLSMALDSHGVSDRTGKRVRKQLGVEAYQYEGKWWSKLPEGTSAELLARLEEVAA